MPLRLSRPLQQQVPLHAGSGRALSRQNFRPAAGSHRHPDQSSRRAAGSLAQTGRWRNQQRVEAARQRQQARQGKPNAQLTVSEIDTLCAPDVQDAALLLQVITRLSLSARAYHRVLKVARSIADLAGSENILTAHIAEALQYRRMDRQG